MSERLSMHRRTFLAGTAAAAAATGLSGKCTMAFAQDAAPKGVKPLPKYVEWKNPRALIVHSDQTIETQRAFTSSLITPEDVLYIRNNVKAPDESIVAD